MKKCIPFVTRNETVLITTDEILYIEQETRKIKIFTENHVYSTYEKLDEIMKYLDSDFYRTHKSLVINMAKVKAMRDKTVFFHNGVNYILCTRAYTETRQMYSNYLITKYKI